MAQATAGVDDDADIEMDNGPLSGNTIGSAGNPALVPNAGMQRATTRQEPSLVRDHIKCVHSRLESEPRLCRRLGIFICSSRQCHGECLAGIWPCESDH